MHTRRSALVCCSFILFVGMLAGLTACLPGQTGLGGGGGAAGFNTPPTVVLTVDTVRGIAPLTVHFDSAGSTDDGLIVSRLWDFGDDTTSVEIAPSHTYTTAGDFTVTLTLTDDEGGTASRSIVISVTQAPIPVIEVDQTVAETAPATFTFDGSASTDPDGTIQSYLWDFDDGSQEIVPTVTHTFASPGTYRVRLTVTDNVGVTATAEQMILVGIAQPSIAFLVPPADVRNIVVAAGSDDLPPSPLWVGVQVSVQPGVPYFVTAGLDRDSDPCDAQAVLYNVETGELLTRLEGAEDRVRAAAFSPDGSRVAVVGEDATLRIYDTASGLPAVTPVTDDAPALTSVAYSPDGTEVVCGGSDGTVVRRDAETGALIERYTGHGGFAVNAVAYAPSGLLVASAGEDGSVTVWELDTGTPTVLDAADGGHTGPVNGVAFSPTDADLLASGGDDQQALVWRISTQEVIRRFEPQFEGGEQVSGHTDAVNAVAFSPDGLALATAGEDGTAKLWNALTGAATEAMTFTHDWAVTSVAFSPDTGQTDGDTVGYLLTGSSDGMARVWDISTETVVETLQPCESKISSAAYSPDGLRILLGIAARNEIQLDTDPPGGDDLNLTIPSALDLSVLTEDDYPAQYYLWVQVDTDRTEPVRTYANARVSVVAPYTADISADTPRVPLIGDEAVVVSRPTTGRQIFDLGPVSAGDRLHLSMATMPGYGELYEEPDGYSLLLLDAQQYLFAWYQEQPNLITTPFSSDDNLVIAHDSPAFYLVVDGCPSSVCGDNSLAVSVKVEFERGGLAVPRQQQIYLDFHGDSELVVGEIGPMDIPPFDAADLNPAWGDDETALIKTQIRERLQNIFDGYDVVFSSDASILTPPYMTVYFGGNAADLSSVSFLDPRNQTLGGSVLVSTNTLADIYASFSVTDMATMFANVAAYEIARGLGLRETDGGVNDIMNPSFMSSATYIRSTILGFTISPLASGSQFNGQIGTQNAPQMLGEILGTN